MYTQVKDYDEDKGELEITWSFLDRKFGDSEVPIKSLLLPFHLFSWKKDAWGKFSEYMQSDEVVNSITIQDEEGEKQQQKKKKKGRGVRKVCAWECM